MNQDWENENAELLANENDAPNTSDSSIADLGQTNIPGDITRDLENENAETLENKNEGHATSQSSQAKLVINENPNGINTFFKGINTVFVDNL